VLRLVRIYFRSVRVKRAGARCASAFPFHKSGNGLVAAPRCRPRCPAAKTARSVGHDVLTESRMSLARPRPIRPASLITAFTSRAFLRQIIDRDVHAFAHAGGDSGMGRAAAMAYSASAAAVRDGKSIRARQEFEGPRFRARPLLAVLRCKAPELDWPTLFLA
jgi:hypothetical protein